MPRTKVPAATASETATKASRARKTKPVENEPVAGSASSPEAEAVREAVAEIFPAVHKIQDYTIVVEKGNVEGECYWKLQNEAEAIMADGYVAPKTLKYPGLKTIERSARQQGLEAGIAFYNALHPLEEGYVDLDRLYPSPINAMLYDPSDAVEALKELMASGVEVDPVTVTPDGEILRGNTRFLSALQRNMEAIAKNEMVPHPSLRAKLVELESQEEAIEFIRQGNIGRNKTKDDLKREMAIAARKLALKPASLKDTEEEAKRVGVSRRTMENQVSLERLIANSELTKAFADELRAIAAENPTNAVDILRAKPPEHIAVTSEEYQRAIAAKIPEGKKEKGKNFSFKAAKDLVDRELAAAASGNDLIQEAIALGDKPESNRHTPPSIVELANDAMGGIELDAFASLPSPGYVSDIVGYPVKAYTIRENAWEQPITGNVFANPPWHRATDAISLLEVWLRRGVEVGIRKLFLVCPISVFSSKNIQAMIRDFDMMVCPPDYRVEYARGEVLKAVDPDSQEGNIRDASLILFYSSEEEDYDVLASELGSWCGRRYVPKAIPKRKKFVPSGMQAAKTEPEPEVESDDQPPM